MQKLYWENEISNPPSAPAVTCMQWYTVAEIQGVLVATHSLDLFLRTFSGMTRFLEEIQKLNDVYLVTLQQVIEWVRKPTPLSQIKEYVPWLCNSPAPPAACKNEKVCEYIVEGVYQYLRSCNMICPNNFPWYGNPDGN